MLLYTYISRFSVNPHYQQKRKIRQSCHHKFYLPTAFHSAFQLLAQTATFAFIGKSGYTLAFANRIAHKGLHGETRAFRMGVVSLPSERFTRFGNPAWPSIRTANFAAFGSWSGMLSKNAESLGTAMRLCASLSRGVAAPLGCVICLQLGDVAVFSLCAQYFLNVRGGGGITTIGVLCVLPKRRTAACQNGLFAVF